MRAQILFVAPLVAGLASASSACKKHTHTVTVEPSSAVAATTDIAAVSATSAAETATFSAEAVSTDAAATTASAEPTTLSSVVVKASSTAAAAASSASSSAADSGSSEIFWGMGTRYGTDDCTEEDCWQDGACSFVGYELPDGIDGTTCVSDAIWNNGANCGGCIEVTYKSKTITVMVTNETGGNATHLDMTPSTWSKLTNGYTGGGVDDIKWQWVTCPIAETEPLWIRMHNGASKYWFAATVENARERTEKLEVSTDEGSTWQSTTLSNYNLHELSGTLSSSTAWVRVTSVTGSQVIVKDVALTSNTVTKGTDNY